MIIPAIRKTYNGKTVLDIPETMVPDNAITCILGHNGSGKSTLAKILAGIIRDDSGQKKELSGSVGYMNQTSLGFKMSVRRNLMLNADKKLSSAENKAKADELMAKIGIEAIAPKNASRLSGGQTERMALARTLMKDYDILILDEPTASMDHEGIPLAEKMIQEYQDRTGCCVLLITHSRSQAERLADNIITLSDGRIVLPSYDMQDQ